MRGKDQVRADGADASEENGMKKMGAAKAYGEVMATRVSPETKAAAKQKARSQGKNLATWLKDLVVSAVGHGKE